MGNTGQGQLRRLVGSAALAVFVAGLLGAAPAGSAGAEGEGLWTVLARYADVKREADAEFAKRVGEAVDKRNKAFEQAYAEFAKNPDPAKARVSYNRWIGEAQQGLARQLAPAAGAWVKRLREFRTHIAEPALARSAAAARGRDDASARRARLVERARTGFTHRWMADVDAFNARVKAMTEFRPEVPGGLESLRASQPEVFDVGTGNATTEPATRPTLNWPTHPADVVLWVQDDDNQSGPKLFINGEEPIAADQVKRSRSSDFLTRYDFHLLPTDVVAVVASDRKTGAVGFLLTDTDGRLIAYSRAGMPVSIAPTAHELAQVARPRDGAPWEAAVRVSGRNLGPLKTAASLSTPLPGDFGMIWLGSSKTGRCTVLIEPERQ